MREPRRLRELKVAKVAEVAKVAKVAKVAEVTGGLFDQVNEPPERHSRFAASASLRPRTFMNTTDRWYSRKPSRRSRSDP